MYTLGLLRAFAARHFLIGGDWGAENEPHPHDYRVEVRLVAGELDRHGYIVDLDRLASLLDRTVARYRDRLLNELPEFEGRNPSIEHFCRCFHDRLAAELNDPRLVSLEVRLWENDDAWASYRERRP